MTPDAEQVARVSRATGAPLRLLRPLPGGEQGGALLVAAADGTRFVVTTADEPWKVDRLVAAAPVVQAAVAHGWPAATWIRTGRLPDGSAFVLQEHLDAHPVADLDEDAAHAVVAANRSQRGLGPELGAATDDSAQLLAVLSDHPWRHAVAARSEVGTAVVELATRLHRRHGTEDLPRDDLVHGDMSVSNLLRDAAGRVHFVDTETVGRGTRVRDLADLVRQIRTTVGHDTLVTRMLAAEARSAAGQGVFATCLAAVSLDNLAWLAERPDDAAFDDAGRRVLTMLADADADSNDTDDD